ncbi:hypothetical protein PZB74_19790 [Porifericola rhodea]|uniref:hypothetical protein n=1 Tax=Porifericola rhodea TaxID=930972 RepID=UPI002665D9D6|nr:hypothetical protein [Porifericola rhodea]WKN31197.1 hypothetical protein PZB74_19790 [Porifericola rhodea]
MKPFLYAFILLLAPSLSLAQGLRVEKRLILSAPLQHEGVSRYITIQNRSSEDAQIKKLVLKGKQATNFQLSTAITFPLTVKADDSVQLNFSFSPDSKLGRYLATLEIYSESFENKKANVRLVGLATDEKEPELHTIVETLGLNVNVKDALMQTNDDEALLGDEIKVSQFVQSSDNKVKITPLARYSSSSQVPFGFYTEENNQLRYGKVGTLSGGHLQHHTLFPRLTSGKLRFDPGVNSFGIFISTASAAAYTDSSLNNDDKHACKVFMLKNAKGEIVEGQYLICFDEDGDSDFQDYIFLISNVSPLAAP